MFLRACVFVCVCVCVCLCVRRTLRPVELFVVVMRSQAVPRAAADVEALMSAKN